MWFKKKGIEKSIPQKKEIPDGVWLKCKSCGEILYRKEWEKNLYVCSNCGYHFRISSDEYMKILLDDGSFEEYGKDIDSLDPLHFKGYKDKLKKYKQKTGLQDALRYGRAAIYGQLVSFAIMDFSFIGGSMGSVVGEKFVRAVKLAIENKSPLITVTASGGARMYEGILSLMQMAKTSAALVELKDAKLPHIIIWMDPTTAGVMASFASLGDILIAEPGALLGFAGPRVIKQTIGQDLPEGFQSADFVLEHGLVDRIVPRSKIKDEVANIIKFFRS